MCHQLAPSTRAASASSAGMPLKKDTKMITAIGTATAGSTCTQ